MIVYSSARFSALKTTIRFPDTGGYWFGAKDYEVCTRPDVCSSCLQQRHLKKECHRLVIERLEAEKQSCLF